MCVVVVLALALALVHRPEHPGDEGLQIKIMMESAPAAASSVPAKIAPYGWNHQALSSSHDAALHRGNKHVLDVGAHSGDTSNYFVVRSLEFNRPVKIEL